MRKKRLLIVAVVLLVLGGALYWFLHRNQQYTDDAAIETDIVAVSSNVSGYITAVYISENQEVKAGDVLAQIDPRDYENALNHAKGELASAEAKLLGGGKSFAVTRISAPLNVTSAQAQVDAAQAELDRAQKELRRLQKLGDGARSRTQLDQAVATEKAARSQLADTIAKLNSARTAPNTVASAEATVRDLQAAVETAKANVAQAQKNLDDTKLVAAADGRITDKHLEPGNYAQPGQQLMSLVLDDYWVVANYKENQLRDMKPGQAVDIEIDAYPGRTYKGKIDSIQAGTGARFSTFPPENATGNFVKIVQRVPVKILFTERPDASFVVGPGMSVEPTVFTK